MQIHRHTRTRTHRLTNIRGILGGSDNVSADFWQTTLKLVLERLTHQCSCKNVLSAVNHTLLKRVMFKATCMCFSAIHGSGLAYLSELLLVYTPSCTLRSSFDTRMRKTQQYKRKTHGFRAFSCFGPHIWNSFPQDLRHCSTLSSFKAKLKTFLFPQYFHPN